MGDAEGCGTLRVCLKRSLGKTGNPGTVVGMVWDMAWRAVVEAEGVAGPSVTKVRRRNRLAVMSAIPAAMNPCAGRLLHFMRTSSM